MYIFDDIQLDRLDDEIDEVPVIVHIECDEVEEQIFVYEVIHYAIELLSLDEVEEITVH